MSDVALWGKLVADAVGQTLADRSCRPAATYRLELAKDAMTFRDAAAAIPYLDELGFSHVYLSPCLKIRSGSSHGYAVVDFGQLDAGLGGAEGFGELVEALRRRGMGLLLDVVSNHMSATPGENAWWSDVLENGPASPYAAYFDVDWRPSRRNCRTASSCRSCASSMGKSWSRAN